MCTNIDTRQRPYKYSFCGNYTQRYNTDNGYCGHGITTTKICCNTWNMHFLGSEPSGLFWCIFSSHTTLTSFIFVCFDQLRLIIRWLYGLATIYTPRFKVPNIGMCMSGFNSFKTHCSNICCSKAVSVRCGKFFC